MFFLNRRITFAAIATMALAACGSTSTGTHPAGEHGTHGP